MIEFPDPFQTTDALEKRIFDQINLIRALANFNLENGTERPLENLKNQRRQLLTWVNELTRNFAKLAESSLPAATEAATEVEQPTVNSNEQDADEPDLITQFIQKVIPEDQQAAWEPNNFTGSLLVFFENGKIDSSSLIEKKSSPTGHDILADLALDQVAKVDPDVDDLDIAEPSIIEQEDSDPDVKVVDESDESFTILKSPKDSSVNFYFVIEEPARVSLRILNQEKKTVRRIEKEYDRPGEYTIVWDCLDSDGKEVVQQRYYCELQIDDQVSGAKTLDL